MLLRTSSWAAGALAALLLVAQPGCSREPSPSTVSGRARTPASEAPATTPAGVGISEVLDHWAKDMPDRAVQLLLELVDRRADAAAYRPFRLSEKQFVALAPADQEALRNQILTTLDGLRALARELERRALEAHRVGDSAGALRYLEAMKQLGTANREPEVPKLVDLVGKMISERAEEVLTELTTPPAGVSPQP